MRVSEKRGAKRTTLIKQVQLAGMLGVNRSAVTDWYARRKTPTAEQVLTMLEILKDQKRESK
jgi:DNA-binding transcriptional regulator YiaG